MVQQRLRCVKLQNWRFSEDFFLVRYTQYRVGPSLWSMKQQEKKKKIRIRNLIKKGPKIHDSYYL